MDAIRPPLPSRIGFDLDLIEKAVLVVLFSFFAFRMLNAFLEDGSFINLLFLLNEAALVVFVLLRRNAQLISRRAVDWIIGFGGTCLPLLLVPASGEPAAPVGLCLALMMSGFLVQLTAKFTLCRSFGVVAANRGVKVSGPYRVVRHPMYAGYMTTQLGFMLAGPNLTNLFIIAAAWSLQIARILAEEQVLRQDPVYRDFMVRTRHRLVPGLF